MQLPCDLLIAKKHFDLLLKCFRQNISCMFPRLDRTTSQFLMFGQPLFCQFFAVCAIDPYMQIVIQFSLVERP